MARLQAFGYTVGFFIGAVVLAYIFWEHTDVAVLAAIGSVFIAAFWLVYDTIYTDIIHKNLLNKLQKKGPSQ